MSEVDDLIKRHLHKYRRPARLAKFILAELSEEEVEQLVLRYLEDTIDYHRRAEVRALEREAERRAELERTPPLATPIKSHADAGRRQKSGEIVYDSRVGGYRDTTPEEKQRHEEFQRESDERMQALRERQQRRLEDIQAAYTAELRMEWAEELLSKLFALGDGTQVAWGEATIEQHEQRIELLMGNILGNIDTLKRHQLAVELLTERGVTCLNDL